MPLSDDELGKVRDWVAAEYPIVHQIIDELEVARKVVEALQKARIGGVVTTNTLSCMPTITWYALTDALAEYDALGTPEPQPTSHPSGA